MNLVLSKDIFSSTWSVNILNLTDEKYQRPDTYNQEEEELSCHLGVNINNCFQ